MSRNLLDPSALLSTLPSLLPASNKKLDNPQDALAALAHTIMAVLGFRLIGVDDSSSARTFEGNQLPEEWKQHGPGSYAFRYRHEQSSLEFLLKISKLGSRTMINAIALETDKAASLDISTNDFTSPSFFPCDLNAANAQPLVHGFISSNRIADFVSQFQLMILQKLVPGLRKDGYTEQTDTSSTNAGPAPSRPTQPTPARPEPPAPDPEGLPHIPYRNPLEIGRRDREPFPQNPFAPPPLFGGDGDGMFVGPNHPIFGSGMRGQGPGGRGPWGGDGYLPPMGAPPGARFDPIGPDLGPFPGGRPGRGLPGGGNMNDPDNDEFLPPGPVSNPFPRPPGGTFPGPFGGGPRFPGL